MWKVIDIEKIPDWSFERFFIKKKSAGYSQRNCSGIKKITLKHIFYSCLFNSNIINDNSVYYNF